MTSLNSNRCYLVMWPDEHDSNTAGTATLLGGQQQRTTRVVSSAAHQPASTGSPESSKTQLVRVNGRTSSTSSEEGSAIEVGNQPLIPVTRLAAYHPVILSREYQDMQSKLSDQGSPPRSSSQRLVNVSTDAMLDGGRFVTVSTSCAPGSSSHGCSKCLLKESENKNLRKRIQALEEQLCRAIGKPTVITLAPAQTTAIPVTTATTATVIHAHQQQQTSHQLQHLPVTTVGYSDDRSIEVPSHQPTISRSTGGRLMPVQKIHTASEAPLHMVTIGGSPGVRNVTSGHSPSRPTAPRLAEDDKIELVPGTNVFVSTSKLQQILSVVKTGKQLARKLMSIYWDRGTLARSTLSASSQHYEQLDPNTISAIKTYCVLFDNSSRKSEIHSTMIDKCVQARRPRRSSLRQMDHISGSSTSLKTDHPTPPGLSLRPPRDGSAIDLQQDVSTPIVRLQTEDLHPSLISHQQTSDIEGGSPSTSHGDSPSQIYRLSRDSDRHQTLIFPSLVSLPRSLGDPAHAPIVNQVREGGVEQAGIYEIEDEEMSEPKEDDIEGDDYTTVEHSMDEEDYKERDNDLSSVSTLNETGESPALVIHLPREVGGENPTPVATAPVYQPISQLDRAAGNETSMLQLRSDLSVKKLDSGYYPSGSRDHTLLINHPREEGGVPCAMIDQPVSETSCQTITLDVNEEC